VAHTVIYERGVIDISRGAVSPISWMWNVERIPVRHLMRDRQDDTTICGHRWGPGDTVEHTQIDAESIECTDCTTEVTKSWPQISISCAGSVTSGWRGMLISPSPPGPIEVVSAD